MTTIPLAVKNPVRVTTTLRAALAAALQKQAEREDRSLSNLIAHILEQQAQDEK
jgi:hypothetical protein